MRTSQLNKIIKYVMAAALMLISYTFIKNLRHKEVSDPTQNYYSRPQPENILNRHVGTTAMKVKPLSKRGLASEAPTSHITSNQNAYPKGYSGFQRTLTFVDQSSYEASMRGKMPDDQLQRILDSLQKGIPVAQPKPGEIALEVGQVKTKYCLVPPSSTSPMFVRVNMQGHVQEAEFQFSEIPGPVPTFIWQCTFFMPVVNGRPTPFIFLLPPYNVLKRMTH